MNINISNFYSDNLSNKASSLLMSSPNLQDSFMSSLHTERQESEGVNKVSYEITPNKQQDNHRIQIPYQIPEASIESSYRLDVIKNTRKYSPGLLTNKEKRIQEKRAKNFNEFHKSLENLASKRLIRTNTQDSNQSIFEMKGNMSMGNVDGGDMLGVKRRFERFHSTQWGPVNSNIVQSHPTLTRPASFYEKDYEPRYLRTECYDDEGSGGHYGIAALANQQIIKADDKARTRMTKRTRHHTHMNINNTLRQSPPKGHALMNSISSTSLYNNRDKQTFYTDAKYSYSPNTDFMFNRSSGAGSKQRKPTFPTEIHYYDREKMVAVDTEGKSIDRKFLEFSSVNGSDSKFGTQRTDFGHSLYEASSIRGSYHLRPNQYYLENKRSNQTSVDKRQRRLMGSKDYGLHERLDQNSISEGVQYGSGGVGQCDVPKGMKTRRSNSRSHKRKGTEIRSRKELEELNDTIKDDNHARVSLQDYRLSGVDRETVGHWKKDLMEIKQDIEKRKVSYHEVSEQLKKYEAEGLLEQIEKELDALSSPEKGNNEQAPSQSPVFQAKRNHRKSTRIFDMDTLATRVSKEAYELSNVEWLHKEKKTSPEVKTMEDWNEIKPINEGRGNRQIIDPRARIKTTLCNEFNNETSFGYDQGGLQHEQRNYVRIAKVFYGSNKDSRDAVVEKVPAICSKRLCD